MDALDDLLDPDPIRPPSVALDAQIRQLALDGLTDSEIAQRLGLEVSDVRASPAVLVPLTDACLTRVERALYEAAVGGETWSEKLDRFGERHRLLARQAPDARAALEILGRRRPDDWADQRRPAIQVVVQRITGQPPSATLTLDAQDAELVPDDRA